MLKNYKSLTMDLKSFIGIVEKKYKIEEKESDLKEAFKTFDKNGDGLITLAELRQVMTSMGDCLLD